VLWALGRWGLQWSWRAMWVGAIVIMQAFEGLYLAIVWNVGGGVLRDGWVFDAMDLTSQVASDFMFFLSIVLVPELVEPGLEGVTYGESKGVVKTLSPRNDSPGPNHDLHSNHHRPSTTDHRPPTTDHRPPTTDH
jgi:hypothetical protein